MNVRLENVRLPLAHYTLEIDTRFEARVTGLFGPSGSGKTSVLEIIAGLRRPKSGTVAANGSVLTDATSGEFIRPERRAIGYVPQEGALFPHYSVRKNLRYGFDTRAPRLAGFTYEHVVDVLEIGPLAERAIATLSGGEKQRVALGRALLASPQLLLLDEPLAGLDLPLKERLLPYLQRVRDEFEIPMVYVTHSPDEVVALCDEVIVLARGRVTTRGKPTDLFVPASHPRFILRSDA